MNHCKDCRFWALGKRNPYGACGQAFQRHSLAGQDAFIFDKSFVFVSDHETGGYNVDIDVGPDFGCVHFEAKEEA